MRIKDRLRQQQLASMPMQQPAQQPVQQQAMQQPAPLLPQQSVPQSAPQPAPQPQISTATPPLKDTHPGLVGATDMQVRDLAEITQAVLQVSQCPGGRMLLAGKHCSRCGISFAAVAESAQIAAEQIPMDINLAAAYFCGEPLPEVEQTLADATHQLSDQQVGLLNRLINEVEVA